jgi:hypothetical protein
MKKTNTMRSRIDLYKKFSSNFSSGSSSRDSYISKFSRRSINSNRSRICSSNNRVTVTGVVARGDSVTEVETEVDSF